MNRLKYELAWLRAHCAGRAQLTAERLRQMIHDLGGIAGSWRTDYPLTTFFYPQVIGGKAVDLSTPERVRMYYEGGQGGFEK